MRPVKLFQAFDLVYSKHSQDEKKRKSSIRSMLGEPSRSKVIQKAIPDLKSLQVQTLKQSEKLYDNSELKYFVMDQQNICERANGKKK